MNKTFVGMNALAAELLGFTVDVSTAISGESFMVAHNKNWFRILKLEGNEASEVHSWTCSGPCSNNISQCRDYAINNLVRWYSESHKVENEC